MGTRVAVDARDGWAERLAGFEITIARDGSELDRGRAENVLGGPVSALKHLNDLLANQSVNPPLAAGEIITTGTLTRAFPVHPGESWSAAARGIALEPLAIRFA